MKKVLLLLVVFFVAFSHAQVTKLGEPLSWSKKIDYSIQKITLPEIDLEKVIIEDEENIGKVGVPYRIGVKQIVNFDLSNHGNWSELENGDRIWLLNVKSENALYLRTIFNDFYLPRGANLHIYNDEKTDVDGAYTHLNNNDTNQLGSWIVKGDNIWIEYFEPANVRGQGRLTIGEFIHVYRLKKEHQSTLNQQRINESGSCNQDVDCPVGADFEPMKDELKHSVALIFLGGSVCTGTLINNTSQDKTPYFLTANHCLGVSNPATYSFRFNWISPNPSCATFSGSTQGPTHFMMNGSTLRSRNAASDFMLLELNNDIPTNWDIRFSGWDRTDANPTYEVGIHHPSGDIMKVCRDNTGAIKTQAGPTTVWLIGGTSTGGGNGWELGVTEGGSSGSALFNQNGRIIGQLLGGQAICSGTNDNNDYDLYGRFATSWTGSGSNSNRLSNWLDPLNTGQTTLDIFSNTASIDDQNITNLINIYPNPSIGNLTIDLQGLTGSFIYEIINLLGQSIKKEDINQNISTIDTSNLENNIYILKVTNTNTNQTLVQKFVLRK